MRYVSKQLEAVHYYLGVADLNLNQPDNAIYQFKEALQIDKGDADALYLLGQTYQHQSQCQQAIALFDEAIRYVPNFSEAYQGLAQCYEQTGQENRAAYAKAMVAYSSGAYATAVQQLLQVATALPDFTQAHLGLGMAYEKIGETEKAIAAYQRALQLQPDLWFARARIEALGGQQAETQEGGP
jgi:tetratricopeptide (TPR) repeat protein